MLRELFPQWQPIPPDSEKCDICVPSGKVTSQKSKQAEMEKVGEKPLKASDAKNPLEYPQILPVSWFSSHKQNSCHWLCLCDRGVRLALRLVSMGHEAKLISASRTSR